MPGADSSAEWSPAAERDVDEIWDYYADAVAPETAARILVKIFSAVDRIAAHPLHGLPRVDVRADLRSVRAAPYVIFYRVGSERVQVVRVLHERRDHEAALADMEP